MKRGGGISLKEGYCHKLMVLFFYTRTNTFFQCHVEQILYWQANIPNTPSTLFIKLSFKLNHLSLLPYISGEWCIRDKLFCK